jgi:hypothetical protein
MSCSVLKEYSHKKDNLTFKWLVMKQKEVVLLKAAISRSDHITHSSITKSFKFDIFKSAAVIVKVSKVHH